MIDPREDGVSHINIYSKGKTELGRQLSNFARIGFEHPKFGYFTSVEGFWYWLSTGRTHKELHLMYGHEAKAHGKTLPKVPVENFSEHILEAIRCKLRQNRTLLRLLKESTLPFEHYYWYGDENNPKIYTLPKYQWMVDEITRIRTLTQKQ